MRGGRDAGFTLLEILVALVVLGFLMVGLSQGTRFGLQAWGTQTRAIAARGDLEAVDRAVRSLLTHMDPGTARRDSTMRGNASQLAFTSDLPMAVQTTDRRADMLLTVDDSRALVLLWTPHLHAVRIGSPPAPARAELLRGVEKIEFSYWRRDGVGWTGAWNDRDLPALIRVRILFPAGDTRRWPDIVSAPVLDSAS